LFDELIGISSGGALPVFLHELEHPRARVIVVAELIEYRLELLRHLCHDLPLRRCQHRDAEVRLQLFKTVERKTAPILQHRDDEVA